MIKKLITAEIEQGSNINEVVIFPIGKHHITAGGNDEPIELDVSVDNDAFERINQSFKEYKANDVWADYNHDGKESSGWLQALKYDVNKGIIATVKWTAEAAEKISQKVYKYISPTFYVDEDSKIVGLGNPAFALTNNPAFEDIKKWPVMATKKHMNETIIDTPKTEVETVVAASVPIVETPVVTAEATVLATPPISDNKQILTEVLPEKPKTDDEVFAERFNKVWSEVSKPLCEKIKSMEDMLNTYVNKDKVESAVYAEKVEAKKKNLCTPLTKVSGETLSHDTDNEASNKKISRDKLINACMRDNGISWSEAWNKVSAQSPTLFT